MDRGTFSARLEVAERRDAGHIVRRPARPRAPPLLTSLYSELGFWSASGISRGSFADVFKARTLSDGMYFALKCFRPERPDALAVWKREVDALRCFPSHTACITRMISSCVVANLYPVIVLDLGGVCLRTHLLHMHGTCVGQKAIIVEQLVKAVRFMHDEVQLAHRDIKLENIVIDERHSADGSREFHVRVCDFGLAIKCDEMGKLKTICGSLQYMAPELLSPTFDGYSGQAVDVWALGVSIFEICENGRSPWPKAHTTHDLIRAIHRGVFNSMSPHVHPLYARLINEALTKSASRRPRARELRIPMYKKNLTSRAVPVH